ncbi:MAG: ester cyclase [Panacagrimonas sp.]
MNIHFAAAWLRSFSTGPEAALTFYADEFDFADVPLERFIRKDKAALGRAFAPLANKDPSNGVGIHRFEAVEYIGDQNSGLVLWKWKVEHASTVFGLPTRGSAIQTTGMSFHIYENGKIVREIVHSDQIHVAQQLGYSVEIPHFWEEDSLCRKPRTGRTIRH